MLRLIRRGKAGIFTITGHVAGRRYHESTRTNSRPHAEAILAKRQKDIHDRLAFGQERLTCFAEAVSIYLAQGGEARFLEPLTLALGPRRLIDITQADVLALIASRYPTTGPQGLNRQVYTPLIAVFNAARKAGMGPAPPFTRPKVKRRGEVRYASDAEIATLIGHASPQLVAAIMTMTLGGARASEACRLTADDIDWSRGTVTLRTTKTGKPRVIHAGAALMAALQPVKGATGPLFGYGQRYSLNQALRRACKRSGLPAYSTHEVGRHAFAARLLREGRTLIEVQKLGGWQTYRMVAEVYGHLEQSALDEASRQTGADFAQLLLGPDAALGKVVVLKR